MARKIKGVKKEIKQDMKNFIMQMEGLSLEQQNRVLTYIGQGLHSAIVNVELCRPGAKLPDRKKLMDAGADLYVPELDEHARTIPARTTVKIPTGVKIELPNMFAAFNLPRSGTSIRGLISELPPIDANYRGEIHMIMTNNTDKDIIVNIGDRLAQLVILPVVYAVFRPVNKIDTDTERGEAAFNSTGA